MADALGSVAVLISAALILATGWQAADPIASLVIGLMIVPRTVKLLRETLDVLLEAAPKDVDMADVRAHILALPGVADVHDLHAWTITSGMPVLSAHVVVSPGRPRRGRAREDAARATGLPGRPLRRGALHLSAGARGATRCTRRGSVTE